MRTFPLLLLLSAACSAGPNDETRLSELTVVAGVVEPPEIAPGESAELTLTVADPRARGADVLVWSCTDLGDGCLEAASPQVGTWVDVGPLDDASFATSVQASPALDEVLRGDDDRAAVPVWTLACEPGLCPVIDRARDALEAGGPAPDDLADDLADPTSWIADLPLQGVALALRTVPVSTRPPEARNRNPVVEVANEEGLVIDAEGRIDLDLTVDDDSALAEIVAFGLATAGGFGLPAFDLVAGQAELSWYAPAEAGEVDLFVVVDDSEGGSAVWRGRAVVE